MWTRQSIIEMMMLDVVNSIRSSRRMSAAPLSRVNGPRCARWYARRIGRNPAARAVEIISAPGSSLFLVG